MDYKKVNEKPVWLLVKKHAGGKLEFVGVYWLKETAEKVASGNMPNANENYALCIEQTKLFGDMIVENKE